MSNREAVQLNKIQALKKSHPLMAATRIEHLNMTVYQNIAIHFPSEKYRF